MTRARGSPSCGRWAPRGRRFLRIFVLAGAAIGVAGTVSGLALGLLFAANIQAIQEFVERALGAETFAPEIYYLSQLPAVIEARQVIGIGALSLALSFLATLYPAVAGGASRPGRGAAP